ncbi:MAG: hypothetical protein RIQ82_1346 [Bacteroidota bacterium]|jgi:hypothetical protein
MLRPRLIGIAGFARSGKDTAAKILQQKIKERWDIDMKIVSFAKALKQDCDPFLQKHLGISAFSEIPLEKEIIRPILVAYGQSMKKRFGDTIWLDKALSAASSRGIIPDVRFPIEIDSLKRMGAPIIYVEKIDVMPANNLEEENDEALRQKADYMVSWPHYGDITNCEGHILDVILSLEKK